MIYQSFVGNFRQRRDNGKQDLSKQKDSSTNQTDPPCYFLTLPFIENPLRTRFNKNSALFYPGRQKARLDPMTPT